MRGTLYFRRRPSGDADATEKRERPAPHASYFYLLASYRPSSLYFRVAIFIEAFESRPIAVVGRGASTDEH